MRLKLFIFCAVLTTFSAQVFAETCDLGYQAFVSTVYAKVRRDCALCHDGTLAGRGAPPFATEDSANSYQMLLSYMNFTSIPESLLVIRAGNDHCGEVNCNAASGREMQEVASRWWEMGEKTCERNGRYFSAEVVLPADLPRPEVGFRTLTIPLESIRPELVGVSFQIDAQYYIPTSPVTRGAYRFRSPRLTGDVKGVRIDNVKILLNGKYDVIYNAYTTINRTIPLFPTNLPAAVNATPVLSAAPLIVLKDGLPNSKISVSFMEIEPVTDAAICTSREQFAKSVEPRMRQLNCASCHNSDSASIGGRVFTVGTPDSCERATALVDPKFFMASPIVRIPAGDYFGHPGMTDVQRATYVGALRQWLNQ